MITLMIPLYSLIHMIPISQSHIYHPVYSKYHGFNQIHLNLPSFLNLHHSIFSYSFIIHLHKYSIIHLHKYHFLTNIHYQYFQILISKYFHTLFHFLIYHYDSNQFQSVNKMDHQPVNEINH